MSEPLVNSRKAAEILGTTQTTVNRWVASGRLVPLIIVPGYRGARLFDPEDIERLKGQHA